MQRVKSIVLASLIVGGACLSPAVLAEEAKPAGDGKEPSVVEQGKKIAFDRVKGNCLACHQIQGGESPGTIGPPLVAMKQRFPEKEKLRAQIHDPTIANPYTVMPPFDKHGVLSAEELDKVVEFIHTL